MAGRGFFVLATQRPAVAAPPVRAVRLLTTVQPDRRTRRAPALQGGLQVRIEHGFKSAEIDGLVNEETGLVSRQIFSERWPS